MSGAGEGPHPERIGLRRRYTDGKTGWCERPFLAMGTAAFAASWLTRAGRPGREIQADRAFLHVGRAHVEYRGRRRYRNDPLFPICDTPRPVVTIVSQG